MSRLGLGKGVSTKQTNGLGRKGRIVCINRLLICRRLRLNRFLPFGLICAHSAAIIDSGFVQASMAERPVALSPVRQWGSPCLKF
jgi:hypothetical protein